MFLPLVDSLGWVSIEFSQQGWHPDDGTKTDWLNQESGPSDCWPIIPGTIRAWLRQNCELIEFRGVITDAPWAINRLRVPKVSLLQWNCKMVLPSGGARSFVYFVRLC